MKNPSDTTYQLQIKTKTEQTLAEFADLGVSCLDVFESRCDGFRMRAEFKIWHENDTAHYAMFKSGDSRSHYFITEFPIAHKSIQALMPKLIATINANPILKKRLFQAEFLTTTNNDILISLIYHKPLHQDWQEAAELTSNNLKASIIGRSKGQKLVIGKDHVFETFEVNNKKYTYQQVENAFTQPNAEICEQMLNWAVRKSQSFGGDLLELYCGNGNFTIPLAANFHRVLATEISKSSIKSALINCECNGLKNIAFLRMSSEEFTEAINETRQFRRLKDTPLSEYQFSTVFVDPPRAGLDAGTCELIRRFENIIYVSCNPLTLKRDLLTISDSHKIESMALFDQFPHTHHRECGVILKKHSG